MFSEARLFTFVNEHMAVMTVLQRTTLEQEGVQFPEKLQEYTRTGLQWTGPAWSFVSFLHIQSQSTM